jgi:hypothetical protein
MAGGLPPCGMSLRRLLLGDLLLDADDHELGRLEWREADKRDHLAAVDVALGHGLPEATANKVGIT